MGQAYGMCSCTPCSKGEFEWSPETSPRRQDAALSSSGVPVPNSQHDRLRTRRLDLAAVDLAPGEEVLPARRRAREKDEATRQFLTDALRASKLCRYLEDSDIDSLVDTMEYHVLSTGDFVSKENSVGTHFFVADGGGLQAVLRGGEVGPIPRGRAFGEDALLKKCPRSVSVVATRAGVGVWAGEGRHFRRAVQACVMQQVADNRAFLETVSWLKGLTARQLDCVSDATSAQVAEVGEVPTRVGVETSHVYFVKSGKLRVVAGGDVNADDALLGSGSCLCERALLYGEPFSVTAEVVKDCELLRVSIPRLNQALGSSFNPIKLQASFLIQSLARSRHFDGWSKARLAAAASLMEFQEYQQYTTVTEQRFFVVLDGSMQVGDGPNAQVLRSGQPYGAPLAFAPSEDVAGWEQGETAAPEELVAGRLGCKLAVLPPHAMRDCVDPLDDKRKSDLHTAAIVSKVSVFRHLEPREVDVLVQGTTKKRYKPGEHVIMQGETGKYFYIIAEGEVNAVVDGRVMRKLLRHAHFGERALLLDEPRSATIEVSGPEGAEIWAVGREAFLKVVRARAQTYEQLMYHVWLQDPGIGLQDLQREGCIGHGTSGTVTSVKHKESGYRYALKQVRKVDGKVPRQLRREIEVLLENDHPFLIHLVKTFETADDVYLLTEYSSGGELHAAIRTVPHDVLSRSQAMFYTGSMTLMLESLHERNVVFRDLKPENIMLDSSGYLKLIDFGCAKKLQSSSLRTFTMVGTPHYMAPEVLRGKGFGTEVDVWALGVILYELVCGSLPFGDNAESACEVYKALMMGDLMFPEEGIHQETQTLIEGLLGSKPERRFGCGARGLEDVKRSDFFSLDSLDEGDRRTAEDSGVSDYCQLLLRHCLKAPIPPSGVQYPSNPKAEAPDMLPLVLESRGKEKSMDEVEKVRNEDNTDQGIVHGEPEEEGDPEEPCPA